MADLLHSVGARLRRWFGNRRHPLRQKASIPCSVSVYDEREQLVRGSRNIFLTGSTIDMSVGGLGFTLPAIRIGHRYIAGENRTLRIVLDLPTGKIESYAIATRYERFEEGTDIGYVVGARITRMNENDRERFSSYLRSLGGSAIGKGLQRRTS